MKYKIAIADAFRLGDIDFTLEKKLLQDVDAELHIYNCHTEEELIENLKDAHIILLVAASFTEKVINNLDNCSALIRYGIGLDPIDLEAATKKNILVCYDPAYCIEDVALHTTVMMLNLTRKVGLLDREVRRGHWNFQAGYSAHRLTDRIVGFVGFGNIARKVMEYLQPFGMKYMVYDPYLDTEQAEKFGVTLTSNLEELLAAAHFVSIHCPLTPSTKHLISYKEFELMRKDAFIINTSRGAIIDQAALTQALEQGQICGAGLDVFEHEPLQVNDTLCTLDQVLLTPHAAFYTEESFEQLRTSIIQQAISIMKGCKPTYLVNHEVFIGTN